MIYQIAIHQTSMSSQFLKISPVIALNLNKRLTQVAIVNLAEYVLLQKQTILCFRFLIQKSSSPLN